MYIILNKKEAQLISIALSIHYSLLHTKYVLDFQFDPYFKKKKKKEYLQFRTLLIIWLIFRQLIIFEISIVLIKTPICFIGQMLLYFST